MTKGLINSIESFGTVDGPGIRMVFFLSGCPLKCQFCHNPEIAWGNKGDEYTPERLLEEYSKKKNFYKKGGATFSGGEPLQQPEFVYECVKLLKENNVHVVIDSSLACGDKWLEKLIPYVDLWLISIKAIDNDLHKQVAGPNNSKILENIKTLNSSGADMFLRYVVVPGVTDKEEDLEKLASFINSLPTTPPLEMLAYHSLAVPKWEKAGLPYALTDVPDAGKEDLERAKEILQVNGVDDFRLPSKPKAEPKNFPQNLRTTKSCCIVRSEVS